MTSNTPTVSDYARRMRLLVEDDLRIAKDLRELAKEMRDDGLSAASLKALVKAIVLADDGNEKPLERLKTKIQDMAIYADALGITIDGFGKTIRFDANPAGSLEPGEAGGLVKASPEPSEPTPEPVAPAPRSGQPLAGNPNSPPASGAPDLTIPDFLRRVPA